MKKTELQILAVQIIGSFLKELTYASTADRGYDEDVDPNKFVDLTSEVQTE